ncbi:uncharacterized protein LOC125475801 [Pyrus x bretschneideri]|uniref:uncharacterized protein LOC125475801 n=1 Tax=Pyrus x bretschneideri TaxID=225117 RepID=UPI0020307B27|nr:uncharacterized protein LOC125475801 [Pyrus x bretschneideri]
MVHKASVVYMILIIILLLFSSEIVFANASENPKHYYTDKTMSRSRLLRDFMMMRRRVQKEILLGKQIGVPRPGRSPGREPKPITSHLQWRSYVRARSGGHPSFTGKHALEHWFSHSALIGIHGTCKNWGLIRQKTEASAKERVQRRREVCRTIRVRIDGKVGGKGGWVFDGGERD